MKILPMNRPDSTEPHIGMEKKARQYVAKLLSFILADTYTLQLKTLNYHWNVTGPHFESLHALFEEQYTALGLASDELAERIRALGFAAPATFREFLDLARIKEDKTAPANWQVMVKNLLDGHELMAGALRKAIPQAQKDGDEVTADLFISRMQFHEKTAWMLRSLLGK